MAGEGGKFLDDGQSYRAIIEQLPSAERAEYESFGALNIEASFPGRKLVVYTLLGGKPSGVMLVELGRLHIDVETGPECTVELPSGESINLDVFPRKLGTRDVFFHMPQKFEVRWKGKPLGQRGVQFAAHYAVLIKTRSKAHHQVDGHTYAETMNKFRERFPDFQLRY